MRGEGEKIGKARIMVVEDERIVAMDTEELLPGLGYQVCSGAASGEEAVLSANRQNPDLVLMDIRLGGGDRWHKSGRSYAWQIGCAGDIFDCFFG